MVDLGFCMMDNGYDYWYIRLKVYEIKINSDCMLPMQIINVRMIYKNDHTSVTELMWGLHWLPIRARIQYKILLLVYKAFTNGSPTYLADMMTSCNPVRSTRSSHKVNLLVVPHQKSNKYSEKAFAVVGPRLWNELLTDELRGCNSVDTFKKKLKTMLFKKHY